MNNNPSTLTKVLSGINNTLNIANKALPIVKEAKPLINTAKETFNTFKTTGTDLKKMIKLMKIKTQIKKDMSFNSINNDGATTTSSQFNNPKFFI